MPCSVLTRVSVHVCDRGWVTLITPPQRTKLILMWYVCCSSNSTKTVATLLEWSQPECIKREETFRVHVLVYRPPVSPVWRTSSSVMWAGRAASTTALLTCRQKVRKWWAREREVLEISSLVHFVLFGSLPSRIMAFTFPFSVVSLIQLNSTAFICAFPGPAGSSSTHQSIGTGENESGKRQACPYCNTSCYP